MEGLKRGGGVNVRLEDFYDTGPTPVPEMIANGFRIIAGDPGVKVILVDIFAGMGRGEHYAQGIVDGYLQTKTKLPVVVRLAGTSVEEAKRVLAESGINYFEASGLHDVAQKAVVLIGEIGLHESKRRSEKPPLHYLA